MNTSNCETEKTLFESTKLIPLVEVDPTELLKTTETISETVQSEDPAELENRLLKEQAQNLRNIIMQQEFASKKVAEAFHENILLRDTASTIELQINCLSKAIEIQTMELCRRDTMITTYNKDLSDVQKKVDVLSDHFEENGYPACDICFKHCPLLTVCENHGKKPQIIGCVFCNFKKCPLCPDEIKEEGHIEEQSKKISKKPKKVKQMAIKKKNEQA